MSHKLLLRLLLLLPLRFLLVVVSMLFTATLTVTLIAMIRTPVILTLPLTATGSYPGGMSTFGALELKPKLLGKTKAA